MSWVNLSEYGRQRGCSSQAVKSAIEAGRLRQSVRQKPNGKYEVQPEAANIEWSISTNHSRRPKSLNVDSTSNTDDPRNRVKIAPENAPPIDNVHPGKIELFEAQRRHEAAKAEMAEMKRDELRGLLVNAESVKAAAFKLARSTRDGVLNIPDRVAAEFAGMTSPHAIHSRLVEEIHKALEGLSA